MGLLGTFEYSVKAALVNMVVKVNREIIEMNRNFLNGSVADQSGFGSDDSDSDSGDQPTSRDEQAINYVIRGLNKMKEIKKDVDEEQDEAEEEDGQVGPVVIVVVAAHRGPNVVAAVVDVMCC